MCRTGVAAYAAAHASATLQLRPRAKDGLCGRAEQLSFLRAEVCTGSLLHRHKVLADEFFRVPADLQLLRRRRRQAALLRRTEDRAIAISELSQELKNIPGPVYLAGDGAKLVFDTLKEENLPLRLLPEHLRQQRASGVALTAMEKIAAGEPADAAALTPNYLRQAQAERTRQHDKDFYLKK